MAAPAASARPRSSSAPRAAKRCSPRRAAMRNAQACEALGATRAINYRERGFRRRGEGGDERRAASTSSSTWSAATTSSATCARPRCGAASSTSPTRPACTATVNFAPMLMKRLTLARHDLRARSNARERRDPRRGAARSLAADRRRARSSRWSTASFPWPRPRPPMRAWPKASISARFCWQCEQNPSLSRAFLAKTPAFLERTSLARSGGAVNAPPAREKISWPSKTSR